MKKLLALIIVLSAAITFGNITESKAQVIVKVKPARPANVVVVKRNKARRNHIWVSSHWKWNAKKNAYVWVDGYYVKQRRGYKYVAGDWIVVPSRGYKWVPGHWVRV